ncbi:MAG: putative ABC transporter permease [Bacilli bacterium]|jgi:uncharacterized membrane protein|nr:putative ABC transporter permease [Bacilli bacterium]
MERFLIYCSLFFIGGVCGWVLELFFRRFVSQKKWVNPGFLTGPLLPLYGFGLTGLYIFANEIPWSLISSNVALDYFLEILSIGVMMTLIEYIAGLIFIKGMHIKLWDYSKRPGNIQGIICPLFSLIWTAAGAAYIFWIDPMFDAVALFVADHMLPIALVVGIGIGLVSVDFGWSIGLASKIRKAVSDAKLVVDWDKIKGSFQDHHKKAKEHVAWIFPFKAKGEDFSLLMNEYVNNLRLDIAEAQATYNAKIEARRRKRLEKKKEKEDKNEGK